MTSTRPRRPPQAHIRAFMAAVREKKRDLGDLARAAGLTFAEAANIWAYGSEQGALRFNGGPPGWRWIEEVPEEERKQGRDE